MPNEILTLQFGNYSNYVATHFWNIQQSQFSTEHDMSLSDLNHDILFREGIVQNRATYTPRMILYDLKDNINVFRTAGQQNQQPHSNLTWTTGEMQVFREEVNPVSGFLADMEKTEVKQLEAEMNFKSSSHINLMKKEYEMESEVRYWPDFLKTKYHERSYNVINQYQTSEKDSDPFDLHHYGLCLTKNSNFMDTFEDKLRHYAEECDRIQGFHLFSDAFNGFGGVASSCTNLITEEFKKKPILAILPFPYFKNQKKTDKQTRLINTAFTLKALMEDNKDLMAVPLSCFDSFLMDKNQKPVNLSDVNYCPELDYHTSAIIGALVESFTTPWRLKTNSQVDMTSLFSLFDGWTFKMAGVQAEFPLKFEDDKYLMNYLQERDLCQTSKWFTPKCSQQVVGVDGEDRLKGSFSVCCNGVEDSRVKNPRDNAMCGVSVRAGVLLDQYFTDMYPKSYRSCSSTCTSLNTQLPYPRIVKALGGSKSAALLTILQVNGSNRNLVGSIEASLKECDIKSLPKFSENGMEEDDFFELKNFSNELTESFSLI